MSTDYYAYVVLGVKATRKEFYEMVGTRGCKHTHDRKFCPDCGKPRLTEESRPLLGWDENYDTFRKVLSFCKTGDEDRNGVLGILCAEADPCCISRVKVDEVGSMEHTVRDKLKGTKFEGRPIEVYVMLEVNG